MEFAHEGSRRLTKAHVRTDCFEQAKTAGDWVEFLSFNEFVRFWVILCNEIGSSPGDESNGMKRTPVRKAGGDWWRHCGESSRT